jgi:hypothetical protein
MKTISWMLLFSLVFYCCYDSYTILHEQADYLELNETLDEGKALITLINDTVIVGKNVSVELDSTSWVEPAYTGESTTTRTVPTWAVRQVEIRSSWKGFVFGWAIGYIIVAVSAFIIIYDPESNEKGQGFGAILVANLYGLIGGLPSGIPCSINSSDNLNCTSVDFICRAACIARHSLLYSSISVSILIALPSHVLSATKS